MPAKTPEDIPRLFAEAWMRRDAAALAALFAEDADFVNVVGLWWHKRADIEKAHAYGLSGFFRDSELSVRRVEVRRLGDTVAVVHARLRLEGQYTPDGRTAGTRRNVISFVAELRDGAWVVVSAQNTDVVPGAESLAWDEGGVLRAADYR